MKRLQPAVLIAIAMIATTSCKTTKQVEKEVIESNITTQENRVLELQAIAPEQLNGEWLFTSACNQPVVGDEPVRIIFDTQNNRIYGNNGCNTFNGTLRMEEGCTMSFTDCITTTKACRPEVTESNVMSAMGQTLYYNVTRNNNEGITIELINSNGESVATIERQMSEILNGNWEVTKVNGKKINLDDMPTMALAMHDKRVSGNLGCNIVNGSVEYDTTMLSNNIKFSNVATTRRMCEPQTMQVENALVEALNKVASYTINDSNNITLCDASGKEIITLKRK